MNGLTIVRNKLVWRKKIIKGGKQESIMILSSILHTQTAHLVSNNNSDNAKSNIF